MSKNWLHIFIGSAAFLLASTTLSFGDEMRSMYIKSCMIELPNQKACECIFDTHKKSLSEAEMLNTDVTFNYRKAKGISKPSISSQSKEKILKLAMQVMPVCLK